MKPQKILGTLCCLYLALTSAFSTAKEITLDVSQEGRALESPSIELLAPGEATSTGQNQISVRGVVRNAISLKINDISVEISKAGQFQTQVPLPNIGVNTLEISAFSKNGEQVSMVAFHRLQLLVAGHQIQLKTQPAQQQAQPKIDIILVFLKLLGVGMV